jgi:hypothetical protein
MSWGMDYEVKLRIEVRGKKGIVELYRSDLWWEGVRMKKWRIKVNGRWLGGREKVFYYKCEIKEMIWSQMKF